MREIDICGIPCEPHENTRHDIYVGRVYLLLKGGGGVEIELVVTDRPAGSLPYQTERHVWLSLFLCRVPEPAFDTPPSLDLLHMIEGATLEEVQERAKDAQVVDRAIETWRLAFPEMQFASRHPFSLTHTLAAPPTDSAPLIVTEDDDG